MTNALDKLSTAARMLAEASDLKEIQQVRSIALAAAEYAKAAKIGLEAQNTAAEIKIRAERKAGGLLAELKRDNTFHGNQNTSVIANVGDHRSEYTQALKDSGMSGQDARRWQTIAKMPEEEFEREIQQTKNNSNELTSSRILQKARRFVAKDKPESPPIEGKYKVIYADPPWKYNDSGLDDYGHAERHYPPLTIQELCELKIKDLAEDNSILFLWVTSPLLEDSFQVINAWGFKYKSSFVWDKVKHNFGHYNSVRHEFLLICTKGNCTPEVQKLFDSVQSIERTSKHSEKPEEFREIIDTLYPSGNRIELFSRTQADGWEMWGNE